MRLPILFTVLVTCATAVHALESDRKAPVEIQADRAELDQKSGQARYEGKVVLTQGTLSIHADTLLLQADAKNQLKRVTATGSPADFSQVPEPGKPPVTARAKSIDYQVGEQDMTLDGDAIVIQNDNVFQGEHIRYDIPHQRMKASGTADKSGGRVRMTLPPATEGKGSKAP